MLQFQCEGCGTQFNVPESYSGRRGRCRICSAIIQAPSPMPVAQEVPMRLSNAAPVPLRRPPLNLSTERGTSVQRSAGHSQVQALPLHEPMLSSRTRRLIWESQMIEQALQSFPIIKIRSTEGQPPEVYQVEYRVRGLGRDGSGQLVIRESHVVEIRMPAAYPDALPRCRMLTAIFHPNINHAQIGATDRWTSEDRLIDLIVRIGRMIGYQAYTLQNPLDAEAALWAEANADHLPMDDRELRPAQMPTAAAP